MQDLQEANHIKLKEWEELKAMAPEHHGFNPRDVDEVNPVH